MTVAVAARFEQDSTYELFARTKKWPCTEVVIVVGGGL